MLYCQWVKLTNSEVILKNHKIWMDVKKTIKKRKILREAVRTYHIENSYKINCFVCFFINSPVVYSIGRISSKSFNSIYKVFAMNCWQNLLWEDWKWSLDWTPSPARMWNLFYKKYLKNVYCEMVGILQIHLFYFQLKFILVHHYQNKEMHSNSWKSKLKFSQDRAWKSKFSLDRASEQQKSNMYIQQKVVYE